MAPRIRRLIVLEQEREEFKIEPALSFTDLLSSSNHNEEAGAERKRNEVEVEFEMEALTRDELVEGEVEEDPQSE
jgi:hypothetical protein